MADGLSDFGQSDLGVTGTETGEGIEKSQRSSHFNIGEKDGRGGVQKSQSSTLGEGVPIGET